MEQNKKASAGQMKKGWICLPVKEWDELKRKVEALKKLRKWLKEYYPPGKGICGTDCQITTGIVLDEIKKLLAQSELPPEAEEEKR